VAGGRSAGTFDPINDLVGAGPMQLRGDRGTDDVPMVLCPAACLIERARSTP
jgi:hypothetical protein